MYVFQTKVLFLLFTLIVLVACGGKPDQDVTEIHSASYILTGIAGLDTLPEADVTLEIRENEFSGQGPVNRYFGQIKQNRFGPIASTMMAGPQDLMDYESRFFAALDSGLVRMSGGDTLFITKSGIKLLTFIKQ